MSLAASVVCSASWSAARMGHDMLFGEDVRCGEMRIQSEDSKYAYPLSCMEIPDPTSSSLAVCRETSGVSEQSPPNFPSPPRADGDGSNSSTAACDFRLAFPAAMVTDVTL